MSAIEIIIPGGVDDFGGGPIDIITPEGGGGTSAFHIDPTRGRQGQFLYIAAVRDTDGWDSSSELSFSGSGITVHDTIFINEMSISAAITIAFDALIGLRTVSVDTAGSIESLMNGFEVIRSSGGSYNLKGRRLKASSFVDPKVPARDKLSQIVRELREKTDEEDLLRLLD